MTLFLEQLGLRLPSPIVPIYLDEFEKKGLQVYLKQEYLIHPIFGGNKWRKLQGNLQAYHSGGYQSIWTFGGLYSNHIYAVAGICAALNIPCHGIIRDTREKEELSPTLRFAQQQGMDLHFVSRSAYRDKSSIFAALSKDYSDKIYLLPEGGTNELAMSGVGEMVKEVEQQLKVKPDYWVCGAGSGGTAAGILAQLTSEQQLLVFPALKGNWMRQTILDILPGAPTAAKLQVIEEFHFGGYARHNAALIAFMHEWHKQTNIPLDPIYNAKSFYGFMELVKRDYFPQGAQILLLHTGGLQGIPGFNKRNALQLPIED